MKILLVGTILLCTIGINAQNSLRISVKSAESKDLLAGTSLKLQPGNRSLVADSSGNAIFAALSAGEYKLVISHIGFHEQTLKISIPHEGILEIQLEQEDEEEESVVVYSTRTSRSIENVPTRVETISLEEIDEKSNMRPANVSMLLHESTGIQVQQTSATSANSSIRIQGLDGRYTQLLKDGFPSFGNFASGLSVLEIPPLDLSQVEIIKGPASPLYGGGAIAGVINFISRTPKVHAENNLLINVSNIGQANLGYFSSARNKKAGYTMLALVNKQRLYDVDKDDFSEVPRSLDFTLHPKVFLYGGKATVIIGNNFTTGRREGGDVQVIEGKADGFHQFYEENKTIRNVTTAEVLVRLNDSLGLSGKQSVSIFDRKIKVPGYNFNGTSLNSFTDLSIISNRKKHDYVFGVNFVLDRFNEKGSTLKRNNNNLIAGVYIQDTWNAGDKIKLESGFRIDYARYSNSNYANDEIFVLPRISLLINYNSHFTSRIGAGIGYKLPTLFSEQSETIRYEGVEQLNNVTSEKSYGSTADLNYRVSVGEFSISVNQMFFVTFIDRPIEMTEYFPGEFRFLNQSKAVRTAGFETNAKFIYRSNYKLFLGYTFTDALSKSTQHALTLVPRHKFNSALIYEKHESIKMGLEAYYTGPQSLTNFDKTPGYWETGFMIEKLWERFSVYVNFENFTNTRQSKFKSVVSGPHNNPTFDEIWTHTEGFVVNAGVKLKL